MMGFQIKFIINMNRKIHFCSISLLFASVFTLSFSSMKQHLGQQNQTDLLFNLYDEPLQPCGNPTMNPGSWDPQYKCSEPNGGVHQICIERIAETTNKFSLNTGQTDWSTTRGTDNHCVCLGAWSLYVARKNKKEISDQGGQQLKCSAIPRIALTKDYVKNFSKNPAYYQGWQRWNGFELQNQVVDGVNELFRQCSSNVSGPQLNALKKNYCEFAKGIKAMEESDIFMENCIRSEHL